MIMKDKDFFSLAEARHCKRAFLEREVPRRALEEILAAAAHAPSSRNTQPWSVAVLSGEARDTLARELCRAFDAGIAADADFLNNPAELDGVFEERARAVGAATFELRGIDRHDQAARRAHIHDNLEFYGAPVAMIFHLPADAVPGSFLAMGCFLQNVMLGLVASGLGSCPQYSVAGYAGLIREYLGLEDGRVVVCGMAVGYPDPAAPINRLVPERAALDDYVRWLDRDPGRASRAEP